MPAQIVGLSSRISSSWFSDGVLLPEPHQIVPMPRSSAARA